MAFISPYMTINILKLNSLPRYAAIGSWLEICSTWRKEKRKRTGKRKRTKEKAETRKRKILPIAGACQRSKSSSGLTHKKSCSWMGWIWHQNKWDCPWNCRWNTRWADMHEACMRLSASSSTYHHHNSLYNSNQHIPAICSALLSSHASFKILVNRASFGQEGMKILQISDKLYDSFSQYVTLACQQWILWEQSLLHDRIVSACIAHAQPSFLRPVWHIGRFGILLLLVHYIGANKLSGSDGSNEASFREFVKEIPLGHAQAPWDLGITAVYLASEAARCINGDTIVSASLTLLLPWNTADPECDTAQLPISIY